MSEKPIKLSDAFKYAIVDHTLPPLTPERLFQLVADAYLGVDEEIILTPRDEDSDS
jgi:hypothetical protein